MTVNHSQCSGQQCCALVWAASVKIRERMLRALASIQLIDSANCDLRDHLSRPWKYQRRWKVIVCVSPQSGAEKMRAQKRSTSRNGPGRFVKSKLARRERASRVLRSSTALMAPASPLIHFIWIFHLELISKIAQVDYRTAARARLFVGPNSLASPSAEPTTKLPHKLMDGEDRTQIDFSFLFDFGAIRSRVISSSLHCK